MLRVSRFKDGVQYRTQGPGKVFGGSEKTEKWVIIMKGDPGNRTDTIKIAECLFLG